MNKKRPLRGKNKNNGIDEGGGMKLRKNEKLKGRNLGGAVNGDSQVH